MQNFKGGKCAGVRLGLQTQRRARCLALGEFDSLAFSPKICIQHSLARKPMESQLMSLAIQTYKITLILSLPMLLAGLIVGLLVSIFQATTQINEMTLSFVPKILAVVAVIIFTMPWMIGVITDYTTMLFNMIADIKF